MLSATTPTQPHEYTEMSRLADYFVVVGYDHEKESKSSSRFSLAESVLFLLSNCHILFYYIKINMDIMCPRESRK